MIGGNVVGRIGNQLSIISAIYCLAKDNNDEVTFPNFAENLKTIDNQDFGLAYPLQARENYPKVFSKISTLPWRFEKTVRVSTGYEKIKYEPNTLYSGYMQSPLYFMHRIDEIRNLFSCPRDIADYINKKYDIRETTCAMHVRRCDYLRYPDIHVNLTMDYYQQAMSIVKEKEGNIKFRIFSDDIQWTKDNLQFANCEIVDENDVVSLYLMATSEHNIIANSSFSFWGAILSMCNNKIVIAPNQWFGKATDIKNVNPASEMKNWILL